MVGSDHEIDQVLGFRGSPGTGTGSVSSDSKINCGTFSKLKTIVANLENISVTEAQ